jgi:hypothetical protein
VRYGHLVRDTYIGPSSWLGGVSCPYRTGVMRTSENTLQANFGEFFFRNCMKRSHERAKRLTMRRLIAAYTNASPLAHNFS